VEVARGRQTQCGGRTVDLVLLDVRMPELDGPQTLAALRKENPTLRCCLISGHSGTYTREQLLSLGAEHYFNKPFPFKISPPNCTN
jgi:CheY-like chemotaxis protein